MIIIYIFVLVLNQVEYLEEILERFVELGVSGGTIIDSTGMAQTVFCNDNVPIVGGLSKIFDYCRPNNKTIFSIIEDKEKLEQIKNVIRGEICDVDNPGIGVSFSIPIENVIGLDCREDLNIES